MWMIWQGMDQMSQRVEIGMIFRAERRRYIQLARLRSCETIEYHSTERCLSYRTEARAEDDGKWTVCQRQTQCR
jgi:hypothetical protein